MKAVLLLHGYTGYKNDFGDLNIELEKIYDTVKFISFPGHGSQTFLKDFNVQKTFEILLNEYDLLKQKYEVIDVIGFSMGGALGTYLQSQRNVNKLVLLAPANRTHNNLVMSYKVAGMHIRNFLGLKNSTYKKFKKDKGYRPSIIETIASVKVFRNILKMCNNDLEKIVIPTLIIWGKADPLVSKKSAYNNYNICSNDNKKILIYPKVGHMILYSRKAKEAKGAIIDFLTKTQITSEVTTKSKKFK